MNIKFPLASVGLSGRARLVVVSPLGATRRDVLAFKFPGGSPGFMSTIGGVIMVCIVAIVISFCCGTLFTSVFSHGVNPSANWGCNCSVL